MKRIEYNLSELFSNNFSINHYNVIYAIKNLLDGRFYIGQCYDLLNRFRVSSLWSHKVGKTYIDNSIRKHGSNNFSVIIIKDQVPDKELDLLEMMYISRMNTYYKDPWWDTHSGLRQYNQDPGGHGKEKMKAMLEASFISREIYGNGDVAYMLHTKEVNKRRADTNALLYNGDRAGQLHTEQVKLVASTNMRFTKLFNSITNNISKLSDQGLPITPYNYINISIPVYQRRARHVSRVFEILDELKLDSRWTPQMEYLFNSFSIVNGEVIIRSDQSE